MRGASVALLLIVACGEDPPAGTKPGVRLGAGDAGGAPECSVDDDCPFGQVCADSVCRPSDANPHDRGCRSDADCGDGLACAMSTGLCVHKPVIQQIGGPETCGEGDLRNCGSKIGACEYGTELCASGAWEGCEGGVTPALESCNGRDDDCNGTADEAWTLGGACEVGRGSCLRTGRMICSSDGSSLVCSAEVIDATGLSELCGNRLDDDCNGATDEGFVLGEPCVVGIGSCARSGTTICSEDARSSVCSGMPGIAEPEELCGGAADDDCDGQEEEGFELEGTLCTVGQGSCERQGTLVCSADRASLRCSATPGAPSPDELCGNDLDDDCDGETDESFETLGVACSVGTPPCAATGALACAPDALSMVCDLPSAGAELCNGADDDGDTCADEGFDVGAACAAGTGVCRRTGTKVCRLDGSGTRCGATAATPTSPELCGNGLDDDCDGSSDEGFPNLGTACTAGQGVCLRNGSRVCSADRRSTVCDAVASTPPAGGERCGNGLDDDCDGNVDEGFDVGASCTVGLGVCARTGTKVCSADGTTTVCGISPGPANPAGELCGNSSDDDCDGSVDEGFDVGTACAVGTGACRRTGTKRCTADRTTTECSASAGPPNPLGELCGNSVDDDCDTFTDEGYGNLGSACTSGVGACRRDGTYVCSSDQLSTVCNAVPGSSTPEVCDNADNDCNSVVDNGCDDDGDDYCDFSMALSGRPTVCPLTTSAAVTDCNDSNASVNPGATESCGDALDQDCDGDPSNGCPACNTSVDADFDGSNQCLDCDDSNGAVRPGVAERCDGVDQDCDGTTDEGFDGDSDGYTTCGTVPGGGIDPARVDCDDANAAKHPGACELCTLAGAPVACGAANDGGNGVDEDCDGYSDETCRPCDAVDRDGDGVSDCGGDCAPTDAAVSPLLAEACDGKDTDCNTTTIDNCGVSDRCNWAGSPAPDVCRDRLICVESLGNGGNPTGSFTCTSLCNATPLGLGLGDGCAASETCATSLTPTANMHGCAVSTDFGSRASGQSCSRDTDCRSGDCLSDGRTTGPPNKYCTDRCGNDSYCGAGTTCQLWGGDHASCWTVLSLQDRDLGVPCNDSTTRCRAGPRSCVELSPGNKICSKVCCSEADCPSAYHCSLAGNDTAGPRGGYDSAPVCLPDAAGAHNRPAGAACTANAQCSSEFCDRTLSVCVNLCCNDSSCPTGLSCESALVVRALGHQTFARVCLNETPSADLEAMP
ncbi:MAG: putative metal-binding motif-containing protein [Deltaproteobacteria bacterium]|nr:putative metal-binding motif-containing protein [Deltaproteobacteria bacterium]